MVERPLILGAGPAGLTAAYALAKAGRAPIVLEAAPQVGGLARTEVRDGFRFDLGGHRFFTKSREVERLWHEVLGDELLAHARGCRASTTDGRFLDYPLNGRDVVRKLGPVELARALGKLRRGGGHGRRARRRRSSSGSLTASAGASTRCSSPPTPRRCGACPCSELRAEWAAQRIKGLSFASAARSAVFGQGGREVRSLIEEFHYPRFGPGQMWEAHA